MRGSWDIWKWQRHVEEKSERGRAMEGGDDGATTADLHHIAITVSTGNSPELYRLTGHSETSRKKRIDTAAPMDGYGVQL